MSIFRVNGGLPGTKRPHLLVFVSYGASSLALVDLLLDMQAAQRQKNNGMTGFTFSCVHIADGRHIDWPWPDVELREVPAPKLDVKLTSRSSQHDISAVLNRDLARQLAKDENSVAIMGYSMTKLSELTLAETVKGRGAAIPRLVAPDVVEDRMVYPLRDATLPELVEFVRLQQLLPHVVPDPPVPGITKLQSIDEITRHYFAAVQQDFPSVVSTVSKVASRLSQPAEPCGLCQQDDTPVLCYACRSSVGRESLDKY